MTMVTNETIPFPERTLVVKGGDLILEIHRVEGKLACFWRDKSFSDYVRGAPSENIEKIKKWAAQRGLEVADV